LSQFPLNVTFGSATASQPQVCFKFTSTPNVQSFSNLWGFRTCPFN